MKLAKIEVNCFFCLFVLLVCFVFKRLFVHNIYWETRFSNLCFFPVQRERMLS